MSVIITNGNTTLNTASGFYRVEAYNFSRWAGTSYLNLNVDVFCPTTFANAGNCKGVGFGIYQSGSDRGVEVALQKGTTVTLTIANPGVVNWTGHGLSGGEYVFFTTTGALPTGLTAGTRYYVKYKDANSFNVSASLGGGNINFTGTQSGTQTAWVDKTLKTLTALEIRCGKTTSTYRLSGQYIHDFNFATPYAVDTTANKWRFRITNSGGTTGTNGLNIGASSAIFYFTWCDTAVSMADNDTVICKNYCDIDKSATFNVTALGSGETAVGVCGIVCSNRSDITEANVSYLRCISPAAAYTLTVKGFIVGGGNGGIRLQNNATTLALANKITVDMQVGAYGTGKGLYIGLYGNAATYYYSSRLNFFSEGAEPLKTKSLLTADAVVGATSATLADDVSDWRPGDVISFTKVNFQGRNANTLKTYTISSIVGNVVNFTTTPIADYDRLAGGYCFNMSAYGIEIKGPAAGVTTITDFSSHFSNVKISGTRFYDCHTAGYASTNYYFDDDYQTQSYIKDCCSFNDVTPGTVANYQLYNINRLGFLFQNNNYWQAHGPYIISTSFYSNTLQKSGYVEVDNCIWMNAYYSTLMTNLAIAKIKMHDCYISQMNNNVTPKIPAVNMTGKASSFYNNTYWGIVSSTTYPAVQISTLLNTVNVSNNKFDNCGCALATSANALVLNSTLDTMQFGTLTANTTDIYFETGGLIQAYFTNPTGIATIDVTLQQELTVGTEIAFTNYNGTTNDDRVITPYGDFQRCSAGLADTTYHYNVTGYSTRRFLVNNSDSTTPLERIFNIPTGNIQNQSMQFSVWVKVNSPNYWAGTSYVMPTCTVTYDQTSTIVATAGKVVDGGGNCVWQQLICPFTPLTTYGEITVTMSVSTDALTTNAYVYWGEKSVLYPAGYKLDLGASYLYAKGSPINPPIATLNSALDQYVIDTSLLTATGTIGKLLVDTNKIAKVTMALAAK